MAGMGYSVKDINTEFIGDYISVKVSSEWSGYSDQYIYRLLRNR
jgi:hypothetical protein